MPYSNLETGPYRSCYLSTYFAHTDKFLLKKSNSILLTVLLPDLPPKMSYFEKKLTLFLLQCMGTQNGILHIFYYSSATQQKNLIKKFATFAAKVVLVFPILLHIALIQTFFE